MVLATCAPEPFDPKSPCCLAEYFQLAWANEMDRKTEIESENTSSGFMVQMDTSDLRFSKRRKFMTHILLPKEANMEKHFFSTNKHIRWL